MVPFAPVQDPPHRREPGRSGETERDLGGRRGGGQRNEGGLRFREPQDQFRGHEKRGSTEPTLARPPAEQGGSDGGRAPRREPPEGQAPSPGEVGDGLPPRLHFREDPGERGPPLPLGDRDHRRDLPEGSQGPFRPDPFEIPPPCVRGAHGQRGLVVAPWVRPQGRKGPGPRRPHGACEPERLQGELRALPESVQFRPGAGSLVDPDRWEGLAQAGAGRECEDGPSGGPRGDSGSRAQGAVEPQGMIGGLEATGHPDLGSRGDAELHLRGLARDPGGADEKGEAPGVGQPKRPLPLGPGLVRPLGIGRGPSRLSPEPTPLDGRRGRSKESTDPGREEGGESLRDGGGLGHRWSSGLKD